MQIRMATIVFIVTILFSGGFYLESTTTWILKWIQYLSTSFYGRSALANNQFDDSNLNAALTFILDKGNKYDYDLGLWGSIGALMGMFIIFYIITNFIFIFNLRKTKIN